MRSNREVLKGRHWLSWSLKNAACLVVCLLLAGCGSGGRIEATGSADQVGQVVRDALEGWKSGGSLSDFVVAHPEVVVADEDWQAGAELADYNLLEPASLNGSHWRQKVELKLKGKSKSKPTVVYYAVTLGEKTSILRSDFQY